MGEHIHNQGTQKDCLMKKGLQRIVLNFYNFYFLIIITDCCMPKAGMMSC
jgi:hypothetical protein